MYKTDYLTYHIGRCESLQELVDLLRDKVIVSHSRSMPKEHDFDKLCTSIRRAAVSKKINYCTRVGGFRTKVAELILSFNYSQPVPEELRLEVREKLGGTFWAYTNEEDYVKQ